VDPNAIELRTVSREANELLELLPTVHSPQVWVGAATSLVLPGLLAKARDDFEALLELSMAGRTSASAAISRVLLEATIEFFYLTSGTRPQQEHRAAKFFAIAAVDKAQQSLVEQAMKKRHAARLQYQTTHSRLRREALEATITRLESEEGQLVDRLMGILKRYEEKGSVPGHPSIKDHLDGIGAHPQVVSNLVGGYQRYYSPFSAFVHLTACLDYIVDIEDMEDPRKIGLRRGKLPLGHLTPLEVALLYLPYLLERYDERFQCGQASRIKGLANQRWTVIMNQEADGG